MKIRDKFGFVVFLITVITFLLMVFTFSFQKSDGLRLADDYLNNCTDIYGYCYDLFDFDYDRLIIFEPNESLESMQEKVGFSYSGLKESPDEKIMNFIFIKGDTVLYYVFGYPQHLGYDFLFEGVGEYTEKEVDSCEYMREGKYFLVRGLNDK